MNEKLKRKIKLIEVRKRERGMGEQGLEIELNSMDKVGDHCFGFGSAMRVLLFDPSRRNRIRYVDRRITMKGKQENRLYHCHFIYNTSTSCFPAGRFQQ